MPVEHTWTFKPRFRARAFGWNGSGVACERLKEAVTEIKKSAKTDPVTAAGGAVSLIERLWPALEHIDTSSGAVGSAVYWTQDALLPIVIEAPADRKTRDKWLDRLWQAVKDDGVSYLVPTGERWGELCGSAATASFWADGLKELVRAAWSDPDRHALVSGDTLCLSSLVAAGRHRELFDLLRIARFWFWHDRRFGVEALMAEGRIDEALAFAEASRGLKEPDAAIDAACEKILIDAGRADEAYAKYGLTASVSSTGLSTFRAIARKYPSQDPRRILLDLAKSSGEPGRWFAAAEDAGFLELAAEFADAGRTDPRTLNRASRDFLEKDSAFSLLIGKLSIERIRQGHGYELTSDDMIDACEHCMAAARKLGVETQTESDLRAMAAKGQQKDAPFSATLVRLCTENPLPLVLQPKPKLTRRRR